LPDKFNRSKPINTSCLEPVIGDVVRITGGEWFGHPLAGAIGLVVDKQDESGEPVETACFVMLDGAPRWIYSSDLTVESRASGEDSGTM
jgi:hypothetical protein